MLGLWGYLLIMYIIPRCYGGGNPLIVSNPVYVLYEETVPLGPVAATDEMRTMVNQLPEMFYDANKYASANSTDLCVLSLENFVKDTIIGQSYPKYVIDAWGKPDSGILMSNFKWIGSYRECLSTKMLNFSAKYCLLTVGNFSYQSEFTNFFSSVLQVGGCFPKVCPESNLSSIFDAFQRNITIACPEQYTQWSAIDIFALVLCALLLAIALLSTIYYQLVDGTHAYLPVNDMSDVSPAESSTKNDISRMVATTKNSCCYIIASSFSIVENAKRIFNTDQKASDIQCLHGMRFLSITWVILGHTLLLSIALIRNGVTIMEYIVNHWEFQAIVNGTYSVDTFFYLSGLLVAYLGFRHMSKTDGRINPFTMYLHRYLRLTPLYAFVLLMYVSLYLKTVEAPLWPGLHEGGVELCRKYWYTNLLYINNLYPSNLFEECYAIGWYLSNDFQFFILTPFFIYCLYKKPKFGMVVLGSLLVFNIAITGGLSAHTEQQPFSENLGIIAKYAYSLAYGLPTNLTLKVPDPSVNQYIYDIYGKPWCRIGSYIIGVMVGYFLHTRSCKIVMSKVVVALGWFFSAAAACCIIYCLYPSFSNGYQLTVSTAAFYNAVTRPLWALCLAWVTIACVSGYGGPVNMLLSWKGFIPLSRLTYGLYLLHPFAIWWFVASGDGLITFTIPIFILLFLGSLAVTIALALLCAIFVEYPITELSKACLRSKPPQPAVDAPTYSEDNKHQS